MASSYASCSCINFHRVIPIYSDGYGDYTINVSSHDSNSLSKNLLFPTADSLKSSSTSTSSAPEDENSQPRSLDRSSAASLLLSSLVRQQAHSQKLPAHHTQQVPKRSKEKKRFRSIMLPNHKNFNFQDSVVKIKLKSFRSSAENKPKLNAFFRSNSFRFQKQKSNEHDGSIFGSIKADPFSRSSEVSIA